MYFSKLFKSEIVIARVSTFETVMKIYWRLFSEYFDIEEEVVEKLGRIHDSKRVKILQIEIDFSELRSKTEKCLFL